ncbi:MAG: protein kinase [Gemmatimonadota bacterium]|nr:MAG: protein kinase [Gemmatimonadota bacterium]
MYCSRCGTEVQDTAKFCPSCGLDLAATTPLAAIRDPSDDTEVGVVKNALKEEYEIVQELGRGGMAIVYKARERQLERDVAIKVLPFSLAFDAEFVERFQREARTAAKLEHPNIIPIYRVGRSGRVIYFVMKFLRGESLSEKLDKHGALSPEEIGKILIQTAGALGYAHRNGIVHRDIKPDNIMFDESGHAILTDFGIAKAATGTRLTGTGMSIGTPHYMSPEQARAQPLDGRSDIYSLGVVAYQCLAGVVPFDGEDSFSIGYKHIMEDLPEPPLKTVAQRSLFQVIRRMLAKAPEERFQKAEDLAAALEGKGSVVRPGPAIPVATERAPMAVPPPPPPVNTATLPREMTDTPTTPIPRAMRPSAASAERKREKKRSGVLVGMLLLLLLGGGGAGGYWYFFLDAQWPLPLPFLAQGSAEQPSSVGSAVGPGDSAGGQVDSLPLAAIDTIAAVGEDSAAPGAERAAVSDTPVTELPNTGTLVLRGVPRGAQVQVNGESVEGDSLELDAGSHKIEVQRTGYEKYEETIQLPRGQVHILSIRMTPVAEPQPPATPPVNICAQEPPRSQEYFQVGNCYDRPPSPTSVPYIFPPAGYQGELLPVNLLVKVSVNGNAIQTLRARRQEADPQLQIAAMRFTQDSLRFQPALRGDAPIEAWVRVTVQFRRR